MRILRRGIIIKTPRKNAAKCGGCNLPSCNACRCRASRARKKLLSPGQSMCKGGGGRGRALRWGHQVEQSFEEMLADPRNNTFLKWAARRPEEWRLETQAALARIRA